VRRYLALYFPRWPVQRFRQLYPQSRDRPLALFERSQRGSVIAVCSGEANRLGVRGGLSVADAKALSSALEFHELDLADCKIGMEELCLWVTRFTPLVSIESTGPHARFPQTLLLDITGCESVFDGEEKLLSQALSRLKKKGYKVRAAIAPTLGAAWALAHHGALSSIVVSNDADALKEALSVLPLAGLRLPAEPLAYFQPLGLHRIGDILKQPRESLPSRFGKSVTERLDQAFGDAAETLIPLRPAPEFRVARSFEYPVRGSELLFTILEQLLEPLARGLDQAQRGARHIECWLYHGIAAPVCAEIALHRCSASRKHLFHLLRARLEDLLRAPGATRGKVKRNTWPAKKIQDKGLTLEVEESVEAVAIHVTASESLADQQLPLFERASAENSGELSLLLDRLVTRLGAAAVCRVQLEDELPPERGFRLVPLGERINRSPSSAIPVAPRPLGLLPQPIAIKMDWPRTFSWNEMPHAIHSVTGPERIESGWWREVAARRDYYIVEVNSGARYWLFEEINEQRWFLHGWFD